jgi:azurin
MSRLFTFLFTALLISPAFAAEPRIVRIKTPQAQMRYDVAEFTIAPGVPVKIIIENIDDIPHNFVLFQAGVDVVAAANKQMEKPEEALKRDWLPDDPRILAHTKMVQPKSTGEVSFTAPDKPGIYPYVCTFPGHALAMQGKMRVAKPGPGLTSLTYSVYLGDWEKLPDFSALKPHRQGEIPDRLVQLDFDDYKNEYGVVFTGELPVPKDGEYRFYLASDDGGRLLIDGKVVVEHDGIHPASVRDDKVTLKAGVRRFRLEYFQASGHAQLFAAWRGGGFPVTPLSKWVPAGFDNSTTKKKEEPPPIPIKVTTEPVIYRNFIAGAGTRGIGVGYPGGFNVAWSAAHTNLALVWRGAFIDAGKHWTSRGGGAQLPLGFDLFRPAGELSPPLAILASTGDAWPTGDPKQKQEGFVWRGYTLDAQRYPTFLYEWQGVKVSERLAVQGEASAGGKLTRTLRLTGPIPANAYFRVATGANLQPADGGFIVKDGPFVLEGRGYETAFWVSAEGAQVAGKNLLIPARNEIQITYSWPGNHAHH